MSEFLVRGIKAEKQDLCLPVNILDLLLINYTFDFSINHIFISLPYNDI
jgi:hypothetical protein